MAGSHPRDSDLIGIRCNLASGNANVQQSWEPLFCGVYVYVNRYCDAVARVGLAGVRLMNLVECLLTPLLVLSPTIAAFPTPFLDNFFCQQLFIRERGRKGEREGEKHQCVVAPHVPPNGDLAHNPGMCPDWELNW